MIRKIASSVGLIVIMFVSQVANAQLKVAPDKYWIAFKDKANSKYSTAKPD
jgi:hypothetical protein